KILLSDRGFLIFDRIINRGRSFEHSIKVLEGKMMLRRYEDIIEPRTIISFSDYQNLINAFVAKIKP
ncbi:MAG: hypothetical protein IH571_00255, partial [Acholeplasmataceae bacterium]|nr:hypothetical protein [Acholeplasmataceae bacterium]